jgi:hypothetical protein
MPRGRPSPATRLHRRAAAAGEALIRRCGLGSRRGLARERPSRRSSRGLAARRAGPRAASRAASSPPRAPTCSQPGAAGDGAGRRHVRAMELRPGTAGRPPRQRADRPHRLGAPPGRPRPRAGLRRHGCGAGVGELRARQPLPVLEARNGGGRGARGHGMACRPVHGPGAEPPPPAFGQARGDPADAGSVLHGPCSHALPDARAARARRGPRHRPARTDFVISDHYDLPGGRPRCWVSIPTPIIWGGM